MGLLLNLVMQSPKAFQSTTVCTFFLDTLEHYNLVDYCLLNATRQIKFGGLDINQELMKLLIKAGQTFATHTDFGYAEKNQRRAL